MSGACTALIFDVSPLNDADGRYLFTPQGGQSVLLPGADAECRIRFSYTVVKLPTIDADSTIAGVQTIAIADHTQSVNGTTNTASGRGQSFPMTINNASLRYRIGRPIQMIERDGYTLNYVYNADGSLASMTDSFGRQATFAWHYFYVTAFTPLPVARPSSRVFASCRRPPSTAQASRTGRISAR